MNPLERWNRAAVILSRMLLFLYWTTLGAQSLEDSLKAGIQLEKAEQWQACRVLYEGLHRAHPDNLAVFNSLKTAYMRLRDFDEAAIRIIVKKQAEELNFI